MIVQKDNSPRYLLFLGIVVLLSVVLFYGIAVEPYSLDVRHVTIRDSHLAKVLGEKVVVQLSDLHIGSIGKRELKLLDMLRDIQPDYIFLTGDYVKWNGDYESALTFLAKLEAKDGIYAVMGDYDYSNTRKSCLFCHYVSDSVYSIRDGIHFLRKSSKRVETEHGSFWIGGLERKEREHYMSLRYFGLPADEKSDIILCHSPLIYDFFHDTEHVVILAGDTHGGQIPIPAWLLKALGYDKNVRFNHGLFEEGVKKMYVSRGIGTSHIPMRLFRRPEIVVLHFTQ